MRALTLTLIFAYTFRYWYLHTNTQAHTLSHSHPGMLWHTHTQAHTHTYTITQACNHMHIHTKHVPSQLLTHTQHTYSHTHHPFTLTGHMPTCGHTSMDIFTHSFWIHVLTHIHEHCLIRSQIHTLMLVCTLIGSHGCTHRTLQSHTGSHSWHITHLLPHIFFPYLTLMLPHMHFPLPIHPPPPHTHTRISHTHTHTLTVLQTYVEGSSTSLKPLTSHYLGRTWEPGGADLVFAHTPPFCTICLFLLNKHWVSENLRW